MLLSGLVLIGSLSACGEANEGKTVGERLDAAVASTGKAAAEAKIKAEQSLAKAGDAMKDATQKAEAAGAKTTGNLGTHAADLAITASVSSELVKDPELSALKIDVDTEAGVVTLTGPAPTAAARNKATAVAKQIKGVKSVSNQLTVKAAG
jgi:hyperosmotically inducible periplasmic protein